MAFTSGGGGSFSKIKKACHSVSSAEVMRLSISPTGIPSVRASWK